MVAASDKRGFTWIELLVVIVILGFLLALLPVYLVNSRAPYRGARCINNMKQIGLGLHNHHDATKRFPPSCTLTGAPGNRAQNGWSWLTYLLPFMEQEFLWDELEVKKNPIPQELTTSTSLAYITQISAFECPSYSGPRFAFPKTNPPTGALTNYKAIGATHHGSLAQAEGGGGRPPARYEGSHPDGALYPGDGDKISSMADGTSHTVMACETIEHKEAVWCLGSTATLVGLPPSVSYTSIPAVGDYWAPAGYNGNYDDRGGTSQLQTYLRWDYKNDGPYLSNQYRIGPSSEHPKVVNHLFGDGTVHSISKQIDAALYFFIITKANGDPGSEFHTYGY